LGCYGGIMILILDWTKQWQFQYGPRVFWIAIWKFRPKKKVFDNWNVASAQQLNRRNCEQKKHIRAVTDSFEKGEFKLFFESSKLWSIHQLQRKRIKCLLLIFCGFNSIFLGDVHPFVFVLMLSSKFRGRLIFYFFFHFKTRKFKFFDCHPSSPGKGTTSRHWTWKDSLVRSSPFLAKSRF